jgi:hypothetical protein
MEIVWCCDELIQKSDEVRIMYWKEQKQFILANGKSDPIIRFCPFCGKKLVELLK